MNPQLDISHYEQINTFITLHCLIDSFPQQQQIFGIA